MHYNWAWDQSVAVQAAQTTNCVVNYIRVHVDTHLQVRSLSSSWRSLQCSSVCLQEHRQVRGSCTNRRFLLSEQWSQHGSQTLDGDTETEVGRERVKETDYYSVQSHPFYQKATHWSALSWTPVCSSWSQQDEFVDGLVLHKGDHQADKHPSSKMTPQQPCRILL